MGTGFVMGRATDLYSGVCTRCDEAPVQDQTPPHTHTHTPGLPPPESPAASPPRPPALPWRGCAGGAAGVCHAVAWPPALRCQGGGGVGPAGAPGSNLLGGTHLHDGLRAVFALVRCRGCHDIAFDQDNALKVPAEDVGGAQPCYARAQHHCCQPLAVGIGAGACKHTAGAAKRHGGWRDFRMAVAGRLGRFGGSE
jgi:hypothetical protein